MRLDELDHPLDLKQIRQAVEVHAFDRLARSLARQIGALSASRSASALREIARQPGVKALLAQLKDLGARAEAPQPSNVVDLKARSSRGPKPPRPSSSHYDAHPR